MIDLYHLTNRASGYVCQCALCTRHRHVRATIQSGTREELCKLIDELSEQLLEVECDRDYRAAILDGSWPGAVELLQRALKDAEAKHV